VGVVGGLISVYFLVLEVRRNAQAIEGATVQSLMTFEKDVFQVHSNNAHVYLRGCQNMSKLSAVDRFQFERLVGMQMSLFYSAYVQHGQSLIDDEVWDAYDAAFRKYLRAPGFLQAWKVIETGYPKSFRAVVEES
jgi:hypothetical protein